MTGGRPRLKTYSAQTGYVYQYTFAGQRGNERGTEYVFDVTRERTVRFRASVFVTRAETQPWREANGRELSSGEQYAIAKIAFQRFLDDQETGAVAVEIAPGAHQIQDILDELGV